MNTFKRLALVVALVVAMGAGFGCAKKQTGADVAPATTADDNGAANTAIERARSGDHRRHRVLRL